MDLDLQQATIAELQAAMADGRTTSAQLVLAYLDRIAALDGPTNSIRELSATALQIAIERDAERQAGRLRGELHGIPLLLKDNIGTTEQATTAGSIALAGLQLHRDAFLVTRLRQAGAVLLGKTNLSEFANWVDPSMPNGWSSLGGQVRRAYDLGDPSGSSSGSGVAASLALAAATVGTETSGSILSPCDVNGLVGVKPTRGLVSRTGVVPLAEGFDTPGPMTRGVADAALLLRVMAGPDPDDPATAQAPVIGELPFDPTALTGARLGWSPAVRADLDPPARDLYDRALEDLRSLGAVLVETDALDRAGELGGTEIDLIGNDFKGNLEHFLATAARVPPSGVRTLADVIAFNDSQRDRLPYGQQLLVDSDSEPGSRADAAAAALALRTTQGAVIDEGLARDDLSAFVAPGAAWANIGASAGYPSVIVPSGLLDTGVPQGLSLLGTAWSEPVLLRLAAAYEAGTRRRVPPPGS